MPIRVAFCFDENLVKQIQVTVASLLDAKRDPEVHYEIYCICTKEAMAAEEPLKAIVAGRDDKSLLHMKCIVNPYKDSYQARGISTGTYLRLMLHKVLPEADKILYADVDVLFRDSLLSLWQIDLSDYVLAAVKGAVNMPDQWEQNSNRPYWQYLSDMRGSYINAGVTLLNLAQIRSRQLDIQWDKWAKEELHYQDQDILNITCKGAIYYLPLKYNVLAYMTEEYYNIALSENIYTHEEYHDAMEHPVIIHYAADKPWNRYDTNMGKLWWDYVNRCPDLQGLFDEEKARKNHGPTLWQKTIRKIKKTVSKKKLS